MNKQYGEIMSEINSDRMTEIVNEELEDETLETSTQLLNGVNESVELSPEELEEYEKLKDEIFEKLKDSLIEQKRLIKRFYDFCEEHTHFEYDEMGMNMEEGEDILRKTDKIRDKFLNVIQEKLLYIFNNIQTKAVVNVVINAQMIPK